MQSAYISSHYGNYGVKLQENSVDFWVILPYTYLIVNHLMATEGEYMSLCATLLFSAYVETTHFQGQPAAFVECGPAIVSNLGVGADKNLFTKNGFSLDFGAMYLYQTNYKMGTNWNFMTTVRYKRLIFRHISHGSAFGIEPNKANAGYNFIGVEFKL